MTDKNTPGPLVIHVHPAIAIILLLVLAFVLLCGIEVRHSDGQGAVQDCIHEHSH